jgi:hypothetical protein
MEIVSRTGVGLARESDGGWRLLSFDTPTDKQAVPIAIGRLLIVP